MGLPKLPGRTWRKSPCLKPRPVSEDDEQKAVVLWARMSVGRYPELAFLFHIPNGGKRDVREAAKFKGMGVLAGVPDLCLPVPRGGAHGLFIEMKSATGTTTDKQERIIAFLRGQGYTVAVCKGFNAARAAITEYMEAGAKVSNCDTCFHDECRREQREGCAG